MKRNNPDIIKYLSEFNNNNDEYNSSFENQNQSKEYININDNDNDNIINNYKSFGLKQGEDVVIIPKIKEKVIPREDGFMWTENEKAQIENNIKELPYGRKYYNEQEERLKILNENPDYNFIKLISGALVKDPQELFEEEDLTRILRERQNERIKYQLEKQRRIVGNTEKNNQLKTLIESRNNTYSQLNALQNNIPSIYFINTIHILIEGDDKNPKNGIGLFGLLILKDNYNDLIEDDDDEDAYIFLEDIKNSIKKLKYIDGINNIKNDNDINKLTFNESKNLYKFTLYFRDLLNLIPEKEYSLALHENNQLLLDENIENTINYANDNKYIELLNDEVKNQELYDNINRDIILNINLQNLKDNMIRNNINYYNYENKEMINLNYINDIFKEDKLKTFILLGIDKKYSKSNIELSEKIKKYINATNLNSFIGLLKNDIFFNYPVDIQELVNISIKIDNINREANIKDIITLVDIFKSHFLWIYFNEISFIDILNDINFDKINSYLKLIKSIINDSISFYHTILSYYLQRIAAYLINLTPTIIQLPIIITNIIKSNYNINLFNELNEKTQRMSIDLKELIINAEFNNFTHNIYISNYNIKKEYLILDLYFIFNKYKDYIDFFISKLSKDLINIDNTIEKTKSIILSISREEENNEINLENKRNEYIQRKSFTSQPINSGIIKLKPFIVTFIDNAYQLVQTYCPNLEGLPLIEIEKSIESGLAGEFARFVALLISDNSLLHPDQYKTKMQFDKTTINKNNIINNLRMYNYRKLHNEFKISKYNSLSRNKRINSTITLEPPTNRNNRNISIGLF